MAVPLVLSLWKLKRKLMLQLKKTQITHYINRWLEQTLYDLLTWMVQAYSQAMVDRLVNVTALQILSVMVHGLYDRATMTHTINTAFILPPSRPFGPTAS